MSRKNINGRSAEDGAKVANEGEPAEQSAGSELPGKDGGAMPLPNDGDSIVTPEATGPEAPQSAQNDAAQADKEIELLRERVLRQAAEFQNFRRRVEQERKSDVSFGQGMVLQEVLDVYDDLRRSLEAAEEADESGADAVSPQLQALQDGVALVFKKFSDVLERFGVEPIEAVGAPFDEHEHEAMMQQPAPDGTAPGTVLAEIQKGYRMGDRVLRHSKVVVSS